jgi:large subunit ribosomal protein L30
MSKLRIELRGSRIAVNHRHLAILDGLGLRKRGAIVLRDNDSRIRGMVKKVIYLLNVEEVNE